MEFIYLPTPFTTEQSDKYRLSNDDVIPLNMYKIISIPYRVSCIGNVAPCFDDKTNVLNDRCFVRILSDEILIAKHFDEVCDLIFKNKINLNKFLLEHKN